MYSTQIIDWFAYRPQLFSACVNDLKSHPQPFRDPLQSIVGSSNKWLLTLEGPPAMFQRIFARRERKQRPPKDIRQETTMYPAPRAALEHPLPQLALQMNTRCLQSFLEIIESIHQLAKFRQDSMEITPVEWIPTTRASLHLPRLALQRNTR